MEIDILWTTLNYLVYLQDGWYEPRWRCSLDQFYLDCPFWWIHCLLYDVYGSNCWHRRFLKSNGLILAFLLFHCLESIHLLIIQIEFLEKWLAIKSAYNGLHNSDIIINHVVSGTNLVQVDF